jgi:hypothetical protein
MELINLLFFSILSEVNDYHLAVVDNNPPKLPLMLAASGPLQILCQRVWIVTRMFYYFI